MSVLDNIRNFYEPLVLEELDRVIANGVQVSEDLMTDVVCLALNHLPPRYIRHEVDMIYYMSPVEREEMRKKVEKAVADALAYVAESQQAAN